MGNRPAYRAIALDREGQVLALRKQGYTFDQIAPLVDPPYADGAGPWHAYNRALARTVTQPATEQRDLDVMRIDALLTEWYPRALGDENTPGEIAAVREVNRLMIRRARLLGLDAPTNHRLVVTDAMTAEIERLAAELGLADASAVQVLAEVGSVAGDDETEPERA